MSENTETHSTIDEIIALKAKFETLKAETEEFIGSAKSLSERGISDAKELIETAKENWKAILSGLGGSGISGLLAKAKKPAAKKKAVVKKAKKIVGKAKKAVKKAVKKKKK